MASIPRAPRPCVLVQDMLYEMNTVFLRQYWQGVVTMQVRLAIGSCPLPLPAWPAARLQMSLPDIRVCGNIFLLCVRCCCYPWAEPL